MKLPFLFILLLGGVSAIFADGTPAERAIQQARQAVAQTPGKPDGYNSLAIALARRARETADPAFYAQADKMIQKSLEIAPGDFNALKARAWILLGRHEFAQALDLAMELNKKRPDDLQVYGFLTDANAELGNYAEAERACNWMLKLRPGNIPGLTRAAYLREIFGDVDGAVSLMKMAFSATPVNEQEDRAWILTQIAHLELMNGKVDSADKILAQALALFPDYHYALAQRAKVRIAQKNYDDAAALLRRRYSAAPHAENLYDLAEALDLAGRHAEAAQAFEEFETKALAESQSWDNANRELIFYYANHAHQPAKALRIAEMEHARRRDVYTMDAYAWALHVTDRNIEARKVIETALAVGIRDGQVLERAHTIRFRAATTGSVAITETR